MTVKVGVVRSSANAVWPAVRMSRFDERHWCYKTPGPRGKPGERFRVDVVPIGQPVSRPWPLRHEAPDSSQESSRRLPRTEAVRRFPYGHARELGLAEAENAHVRWVGRKRRVCRFPQPLLYLNFACAKIASSNNLV